MYLHKSRKRFRGLIKETVPMKTRTPLLTKISYTTAICLAGFSGAVATFGMTKLVPGGEIVVAGLGLLFEAGKLTSFAVLHRPLPRLLKIGLAAVGITLMTANVAGVSGFLSAAYERQQLNVRAAAHTEIETAHASASLVERQLAAAETNLAQARTQLVRARDDKGRIKAAQAIVTTATAERNELASRLTAAQSGQAKSEGDAINAGSEFAAIAFIAAATGASADKVAHAVILVIATMPDLLSVLLLLAAGHRAPAPIKVKRRKLRRPVPPKRRPPAVLKVVPIHDHAS
jgi:hypothetical protein